MRAHWTSVHEYSKLCMVKSIRRCSKCVPPDPRSAPSSGPLGDSLPSHTHDECQFLLTIRFSVFPFFFNILLPFYAVQRIFFLILVYFISQQMHRCILVLTYYWGGTEPSIREAE